MLKPGDKAPDFSLPDQAGRTVTLDDLLADGPLILFFYPADFTPICTRESAMPIGSSRRPESRSAA